MPRPSPKVTPHTRHSNTRVREGAVRPSVAASIAAVRRATGVTIPASGRSGRAAALGAGLRRSSAAASGAGMDTVAAGARAGCGARGVATGLRRISAAAIGGGDDDVGVIVSPTKSSRTCDGTGVKSAAR